MKRYVILFVATLCCVWNIQAQHLSFHNISSNSQLPSGETRKLCQDSDGYLWIPTSNGLVRYDGYDFLFIKTDKSTQKQVLSGYVNLVSEDGYGNLWIGTNNGLFLLDKETGTLSKKLTPVMDNSHIEAVLPAKDGTVWVATNKGLFAKLAGSEDFAYCTEKEWGITPTDMKTLAMDNAGYLWIGTWSEGLLRYDVRGKKVIRFKSLPELKSPHTLFFDRDRNLWAGTWGSGLLRLDNLYSASGPNITVYRKGRSDTSLLDDIIYCINQDPVTGDLWIGSRSGLSILPEKDLLNPEAAFRNYSPDRPGYDLPFNEINSIIPTRDNYMWLSSGGGGVFYTDTRTKEIEGNSLNSIRKKYGTSSVRALSHSSDGVLRLSISGYGLFEYDMEKDRYTKFQSNYIQDFIEIEDGQVLAGSETGIMVCRKGQLPYKKEIPGFSDPFITRFHKDLDGNLWVGTREDFGILTEDWRYVSINGMLRNPDDSIPPCLVCDLTSESSGSIWAATSDNGIFHFKLTENGYERNHIEMPLTDGALCLCSDSGKRIWVGTENGLYVINNGELQMVKPGDALLSNGTVVTNIREDRNGSLWIATNKGLIQMNRDKDGNPDRICLFTSTDGMTDNYIPRNTIEELEDGTFLIGSAHGISIVPLLPSPSSWEREGEDMVTITDFKIFDKSLRTLPPPTNRT
ncbi:MAG: two-component regulator propeller domain-containing protein [Candidatus Cryptobacteroides sp.]